MRWNKVDPNGTKLNHLNPMESKLEQEKSEIIGITFITQ